MLRNDLAGSQRSPRLRVLVDGRLLTGAYRAEVVSNNHYSADSYSVFVALGVDAWANADFWASQTSSTIEVALSLDGAENFTRLISGSADLISVDPLAGTVDIQGRDFSASLIESETQETFSNRTASEIAVILAERHGLLPCVIHTTGLVGRFYENDRESLTLSQFSTTTTEWDLLAYLARQEKYDLFVDGKRLHFQPATDGTMVDRTLCLSDMISIRLERTIPLGRDIEVTVKSWNTAKQTAFSETVIGSVTDNLDGPAAEPSRYCLVRPNLTPDTALAFAYQRLEELSRHERSIDFVIPGELQLTPRSMIALSGTDTAFDQRYYIGSIQRSFCLRTGFRERIRACNSSPRTTKTVSS